MRATTADGQTLQVPDASLTALLPQLRRSGLGHLVRANFGGDIHNAVARSIRDVAQNASRVGTLRHPNTGQRFPVFSSALGDRSYRLITRQLGPARNALVSIRPHAAPSAETETGPGAADIHIGLFRHLERLGLVDAGAPGAGRLPQDRAVRYGMAQVNAAGQTTPNRSRSRSDPSFNKPDISYIDSSGRRVNIEIDTRGPEMRQHRRLETRADPQALHIGVRVNRQGQILEVMRTDPSTGRPQRIPVPAGGLNLQQAISNQQIVPPPRTQAQQPAQTAQARPPRATRGARQQQRPRRTSGAVTRRRTPAREFEMYF
jgi:hypothetical protein